MLPLGVCWFLGLLTLFAGDLLAQSDDTSVVCVAAFLGAAEALGLGVALFADVVAMVGVDDRWGGEGGRPVEGANRDASGSLRFCRGFLNIAQACPTVCEIGRQLLRAWWHWCRFAN